jgi:hypothetical protein
VVLPGVVVANSHHHPAQDSLHDGVAGNNRLLFGHTNL